MLQGLERLARDADTKVDRADLQAAGAGSRGAVLAAARRAGKPVVVNFLGAAPKSHPANLYPVKTLEDAARAAVALARRQAPAAAGFAPGGEAADRPSFETARDTCAASTAAARSATRPRCSSASAGATCYSNTPVDAKLTLADRLEVARPHAVDLGDDVFTRGRPHPMIDHRLRNERIARGGRGSGDGGDPARRGAGLRLAPRPGGRDRAGHRGCAEARSERRPQLAFVGFVCGTDGDPQGLARQEAALREAGVLLADSNAQAVRLAARLRAPRARRSARDEPRCPLRAAHRSSMSGLASFAEAIAAGAAARRRSSTGRRRPAAMPRPARRSRGSSTIRGRGGERARRRSATSPRSRCSPASAWRAKRSPGWASA